MVRSSCLLALPLLTMAGQSNVTSCGGGCCYPGVCTEPASKYKNVYDIKPRQQWNIGGGFCGSLSTQVMLMAKGAWLSQDLIRKGNIGAPCAGHGDNKNGCEVGPENYAQTAEGLRLKADVWDYTQGRPQAAAFKAWIKAHLAQGNPVMWAPMEKGEGHAPYGPDSVPGDGAFDHHEPIIGIGSQHPLSDTKVYDDDWLLHFSAQDLMPYYRTFDSLEDGKSMDGNCKNAGTGYPDREAYPCFYETVAYGMAVNGFAIDEPTLPVSIDVDRQDEPNVRLGQKPATLHAKVQVRGLVAGQTYTLYRYKGINSFPSSDFETGYEEKHNFDATGEMWEFNDPSGFPSNDAVYYIAVPAASSVAV